MNDAKTTWESFAGKLARDLTRLREDDTVALNVGRRYVQVLQLPDMLLAETVANGYLPPEAQLSDADRRRIVEMGWQEPVDARDNWRVELAWPVHSRDSRHLAEMLVRTLREVHGAVEPEALTYNAFNTATGAGLELPALAGLRRAD